MFPRPLFLETGKFEGGEPFSHARKRFSPFKVLSCFYPTKCLLIFLDVVFSNSV